MLEVIDFVALERAAGSVSSSHTSSPCTAASWAIPEPIWPLPTTPTALISVMFVSLSSMINGFGRSALDTVDKVGSPNLFSKKLA